MKKKWELARDPIVRPLLCGAVITLSSTVFFQFSLLEPITDDEFAAVIMYQYIMRY